MSQKILTLCLIHQHPKVLLGMKKRGFGVGCWNGFGGKVESGESIEQAARREVKEEIGVFVDDLEKTGELDFRFDNTEETLKIHVFRVTSFSGEPKESDEMNPKWFFVDEIPFKKMWSADVYWMPLFFAGKRFKGQFVFSDTNTLIDRNIEITN